MTIIFMGICCPKSFWRIYCLNGGTSEVQCGNNKEFVEKYRELVLITRDLKM